MANQSLEEFVESMGGGNHLRVEHDFGGGFVRLRTSEAERRQAAQDIRNSESIVLELLRNSRDAHASAIFLAMSREGSKRSITVIDNGEGIPASMHEHVFEPRVTSKLDTHHLDAWGMHGRGMALYSIRVNSERAEVVTSEEGLGCSIHVETDTETLSERADQSTFPSFELVKSGNVNIRGPRNILRTACEFALEARDTCDVYVGSPVEIAAALYSYGTSTLSAVDRAFCKDVDELPIVKRLAVCADPGEFAEKAASMGLVLSARSARRVIEGDVAGPESIIERITIIDSRSDDASRPKRKTGKTPMEDARSVKLGMKERQELALAVKEAFEQIADGYYLEADIEPSVKTMRDRIVITVPIVKRP